jgi:hypothetical protein
MGGRQVHEVDTGEEEDEDADEGKKEDNADAAGGALTVVKFALEMPAVHGEKA